MIKLWSIGRITFLQTIRQPIYAVILLATFAVVVLSLPLSGWTLGEAGKDYHETDQRLLESMGISTLLMSGLLLAAFSASTALSREIEEKTALTVVSKPVSRTTFVLGKFAGVAAAVTAAFYLCSLVFLMTVRHKVMSAVSDPYDVPVIVLGVSAFVVAVLAAILGNYFFGWSFTSTCVWTALVGFSVAMGLLTFIGKDWKLVPPGYDAPPTYLIRVEVRKESPLTEVMLQAAPNGFRQRSQAGQQILLLLPDDRTVEQALREARNWSGVQSAQAVPEQQPAIYAQLLLGMVLMFLCVMVLVAVAVTASTRLGSVLTLLTCVGVFLIGWLHPRLFTPSPGQRQLVSVKVLGWIAPNLTFLDPQDPMSAEKSIPLQYVGLAAAYSACYIAAVLALGVVLFQRRALETQTSSGTMPGAVAVLAWLGRAAAVAMGLAAVIVLELPEYHDPSGFALIGGLLVAAAGGWLLWGFFGRGAKWSYWVVLAGAAAALCVSLTAMLFPPAGQVLRLAGDKAMLRLLTAASLAILLILLLPKTRHHFRHEDSLPA